MVKYRVMLTEQEREALKKMVSAGKGAARKLLHARILLLIDMGDYLPNRPKSPLNGATRAIDTRPTSVSIGRLM